MHYRVGVGVGVGGLDMGTPLADTIMADEGGTKKKKTLGGEKTGLQWWAWLHSVNGRSASQSRCTT